MRKIGILLLIFVFADIGTAQVSERWISIKFGGKKIGYTVVRQERGRFVEITSMKVRALGEKRRVDVILIWEPSENFSVKKFEFEMASAGSVAKVEGYIWKDKLLVKVNGFPREFFPVKELKIGLSYILFLEDAISKGKIPQKVEFNYFDPSVLSFGKMIITFLGKERGKLVFSKTFAGLTSKLYFDGARWVREEAQANVVYEASSEEGAKKTEDVDLILATAVKVEGRLPTTRNVRFLRIEIESPYGFPEFPDQKVYRKDGKFIVERIADELSPDTRYRFDEREIQENLKREPLIDFSDPKILSVAKSIGVFQEPTITISKVVQWVFSNLKKTSSLSMPSASEVIRQMAGDCNEHAILTVALLRALKVPARVVFGLVYQNGYFFYHAWVEAWNGRMWYEVDPTSGQVPADPIRIKVGVGNVERWNEVLKYVGKIKITIKEWW